MHDCGVADDDDCCNELLLTCMCEWGRACVRVPVSAQVCGAAVCVHRDRDHCDVVGIVRLLLGASCVVVVVVVRCGAQTCRACRRRHAHHMAKLSQQRVWSG
eukprot:GHVU01138184.1.p1 GENE.GHVU01138184.1~~GHVU01138184.1.p1  ORF type:complete len:102 (+),score=7.94 GHVU01138184.1:192-497(+)